MPEAPILQSYIRKSEGFPNIPMIIADMPRVLITTPLPVPYQVELFDGLSASGAIQLTVLYEKLRHKDRAWELPEFAHRFYALDDQASHAMDSLLDASDLVVFSGYGHTELLKLIRQRAKSGRAWCFWGERLGFHLPQWLGQYYRRYRFPELGDREIPIWGMGAWAVASYRQEFGDKRALMNVPYFSCLADFLSIERPYACEAPRRILFSGSLIKRKGVDLLMQAFLAIAGEFPELELDLIGEGPLREPLEKMAQERPGRVHFHGFRQWDELPRFYSQADILCAPSRHDGWGMIVPEGLAAGLLVISTDRTGAARELVGPDVGWVIEADRLEPLIAALRAAVSTQGTERIARIELGRKAAATQDVTAGVPRVLEAIGTTLAAFGADVASVR